MIQSTAPIPPEVPPPAEQEATTLQCANPQVLADARQADRRIITHRLARLVLGGFLFTFLIARILVILIMAHKLPSVLFFHAGGTHVHHLNYGITLLSATGAFLIFLRPTGRVLSVLAALYGIGLGLTFDEFGMWLHLGGAYWQRTSIDGVVVVGAVLALIAYGAMMRRWEARHHFIAIALAIVLCTFGYVVVHYSQWANENIAPMFDRLETNGPS